MKKFKRLLASLFCVLFALGSISFTVSAEEPTFWSGTAAAEFAAGTGTAADPFIIKTAEQLAYFSKTVNGGIDYSSYHILLDSDIYLNDFLSSNTWGVSSPSNNWIPIGSSAHPFTGDFDGNNHKIFGLYSVGKDCGLFGYVSNATIKNIIVTQSYISATNNAGGICAVASKKSTISNCENYATVYGDNAGGIAGKTSGSYNNISLINYCDNHSGINGNSTAGGIVGDGDYTYIKYSYNDSEVSGNISGGIVGYYLPRCTSVYSGTSFTNNFICYGGISYCYNSGEIIGSTAGGLIGIEYDDYYFNGTNAVVEKMYGISYSYSVGAVSGDSLTGLLVGQCQGGITSSGYMVNFCKAYNPKPTVVDLIGSTNSEKNNYSMDFEQATTTNYWSNFETTWKYNGENEYQFPELIDNPHHKHSFSLYSVVSPTCEDDGYSIYICNDCGIIYNDNKISAIGHDYAISYDWQNKNNQWICQAKAVCSNDSTHTIIESPIATSEIIKNSTCENYGTSIYSATFISNLFETQCLEKDDILPINHKWKAPEYLWADNNNRCTAVFICENDNAHKKEIECTVKSETVNPSCENIGFTKFTASCSFNGQNYISEYTVPISPIGHDYEIKYTWNNDFSCTATAICKNDNNHIISETAYNCGCNGCAASCEEDGFNDYVANFSNPVFEPQYKRQVLKATGHTFENYVYNNDATIYSDGTETGTCHCGKADTRTAVGTKLKTTISIRNMSKYNGTKLAYKSTITFYADVDNSAGNPVIWHASGATGTTNADGSYTVKEATGDFTIYCSTSDIDGIDINSEIETIKIKHGFFDKIISFIKLLFNKSAYIFEQK